MGVAMLTKLSYLDRIKLLMMAMMTLGHLAWAFVPESSSLSQWLHFVARPTVVLACFLVVEGFRLTGNLDGYVKRLFGFGLLAQPPYIMMSFGVYAPFYQPSLLFIAGNVLLTLGCALLAIIQCDKMSKNNSLQQKFQSIAIIAVLILWVHYASWDWGYAAILWAIGIYYKRILGFIAVTAVLVVLSIISDHEFLDAIFSGQMMDYGILLSLPIMYWYDKNRHQSPKNYRLPRTLFYWYYVMHALIIGLLVQFTPYAVDEYGDILERDGQVKKVVPLFDL